MYQIDNFLSHRCRQLPPDLPENLRSFKSPQKSPPFSHGCTRLSERCLTPRHERSGCSSFTVKVAEDVMPFKRPSDFVGNRRLNRYIHRIMNRAAVAIIVNNKLILACQRRRNSRYELKWEFPGGKIEEGESLLDCLRRELREELSIEIDGYERVETTVNRYADGAVFEVAYCFVRRFEGTLKNNIFEQIRWVSLEELKQMDILDGNRPFVTSLQEANLLPANP